MKLHLDLQQATVHSLLPSEQDFYAWIQACLQHEGIEEAELTIRLVDRDEIQTLNHQYRYKDKPTNVLSFPFEDDFSLLEVPFLGDLIICATIIEQEALEQQKQSLDHWAHITIHGCLHLLGYDHIEDQEANEMETLEKLILKQFNITDPYR